MAETYIARKEDLTAVANEIRSKGKTSEKLVFPHGFEGAIRAIQVRDEEEKDITFHDYDGTLLYEYTIEEAQLLTSLPPAPEHEGLIFDGWNWSLEDVRELTYPMRIGANYITDDGSTRLYMHFVAPLLHTYLRWKQDVAHGVTIDWGDGSSPETFDGSGTTLIVAEHTYTAEGDYIIKMTPQDDCTLTLTSGSHMYPIIGWRLSKTNVNAYNARLTKLELGRNLGVIDRQTFSYCMHLEYVSVPHNVLLHNTQNVFTQCYNLTAIVIPPSMTSTSWFDKNYRLSTVCLPKTIVKVENYAFDNCQAIKKITLPEGVTSIGNNAFNNDCSLKRIRIPSTVTSIGNSVFSNCHGLECMPDWPDGIGIGSNLFNTADSMGGDVVIKDGVTEIGTSAFRNTRIKSIHMPDTVTSIGNSAFQSTLLTEVTLPPSLTTLGTYTFYGCISLKKIVIPDNLTTIPSYFCHGCISLTEVHIPEGITAIGTNAFNNCSAIPYTVIPASVTSIEAKAFQGNSGTLEYHLLSETPPTLANVDAFSGIPAECIIYVPAGCLEAYQTATNWSTYANYM